MVADKAAEFLGHERGMGTEIYTLKRDIEYRREKFADAEIQENVLQRRNDFEKLILTIKEIDEGI